MPNIVPPTMLGKTKSRRRWSLGEAGKGMWLKVKRPESETFYNLSLVSYIRMCPQTQTLFLAFVNGEHERFKGEEAAQIYDKIKKILGGGGSDE